MTKSKLAFMVAFLLAVFTFPTIAMAAIDAETVVTGKCTACHMADRIRNASKTKKEWENWIDKEIERGAQLTRGERRAVIDWLAANYGQELDEDGQTPTEPVDPDAPAYKNKPANNDQVAQAEVPSQSEPQSSQAVASAESLPFEEQAETGVELWHFLLSGGALISGGALLRRR